MSKKEIRCILCSQVKTPYQLAKHRNEQLSDECGFCKDCINTYAEQGLENITNIFRLMNVPFVNETWDKALEIGGNNIFTKYLQLIATSRRHKDFLDSDIFDLDASGVEQEELDTDFEVTTDVIERWGSRDSDREYMELELAYRSLVKIKEPTTLLEQKRYVQNVKLGKALDIALETGDVKVVPNLRTAYTKDLEELGLNIDMSGQEEGRSLGMRIKEWEMEAPIPTDSVLDDVDGVKEYVSKWFTTQMKRVFGLASEEEITSLYEE